MVRATTAGTSQGFVSCTPKAWSAFDAMDKDVDLSPEGKPRQKKKVTAKAIARV